MRHLSHRRDDPRHDVIRDATVEVIRPALFGQMIIMIVFVPILALDGVEWQTVSPGMALYDGVRAARLAYPIAHRDSCKLASFAFAQAS